MAKHKKITADGKVWDSEQGKYVEASIFDSAIDIQTGTHYVKTAKQTSSKFPSSGGSGKTRGRPPSSSKKTSTNPKQSNRSSNSKQVVFKNTSAIRTSSTSSAGQYIADLDNQKNKNNEVVKLIELDGYGLIYSSTDSEIKQQMIENFDYQVSNNIGIYEAENNRPIKAKAYHSVISLPKNTKTTDGREISQEEQARILEEVTLKVLQSQQEFKNRPILLAVHQNQRGSDGGTHIHILRSNISNSGERSKFYKRHEQAELKQKTYEFRLEIAKELQKQGLDIELPSPLAQRDKINEIDLKQTVTVVSYKIISKYDKEVPELKLKTHNGKIITRNAQSVANMMEENALQVGDSFIISERTEYGYRIVDGEKVKNSKPSKIYSASQIERVADKIKEVEEDKKDNKKPIEREEQEVKIQRKEPTIERQELKITIERTISQSKPRKQEQEEMQEPKKSFFKGIMEEVRLAKDDILRAMNIETKQQKLDKAREREQKRIEAEQRKAELSAKYGLDEMPDVSALPKGHWESAKETFIRTRQTAIETGNLALLENAQKLKICIQKGVVMDYAGLKNVAFNSEETLDYFTKKLIDETSRIKLDGSLREKEYIPHNEIGMSRKPKERCKRDQGRDI